MVPKSLNDVLSKARYVCSLHPSRQLCPGILVVNLALMGPYRTHSCVRSLELPVSGKGEGPSLSLWLLTPAAASLQQLEDWSVLRVCIPVKDKQLGPARNLPLPGTRLALLPCLPQAEPVIPSSCHLEVFCDKVCELSITALFLE